MSEYKRPAVRNTTTKSHLYRNGDVSRGFLLHGANPPRPGPSLLGNLEIRPSTPHHHPPSSRLPPWKAQQGTLVGKWAWPVGERGTIFLLTPSLSPRGYGSTRKTQITRSDPLQFLSAFPLLLRSAGIPQMSAQRGLSERDLPPALQGGPGRWRPGRGPYPFLGAELALARETPASSEEAPLVLGAEDWDFVGQLN